MSSTMTLWGNLSWHPAAAAWREAAPTAAAPDTIEVLGDDDGKKRYRLVGVGSGGASVLAFPTEEPGAWVFREET
jgi:hypothetical protein